MAISRDFSNVDLFCSVLQSPAFITMNHTALKALSSDNFVRLDYFEMMMTSTISTLYNLVLSAVFAALDLVDCSGKNIFYERRNVYAVHTVASFTAAFAGLVGIFSPVHAVLVTVSLDVWAIKTLEDDQGNYSLGSLGTRSINWLQNACHNFFTELGKLMVNYGAESENVDTNLLEVESALSDTIQELADKLTEALMSEDD